MSPEQMRAYLIRLPYGPSWVNKVEKMSNRQVAAVYMRHINKK